MAVMDKNQAAAMGRRAHESGFSRTKALRHAPTIDDLQKAFMDAYDQSDRDYGPSVEAVTDQAVPDETVQEALMELLEVKLAAFMGRADLSDSPPVDKVAIRAAYFLGVSAGLSLGNAIAGADGERAAAALDVPGLARDQAG